MVGNRLYNLINLLTASQSKTILNICKDSNDKRKKALAILIKARPYKNEAVFQAALNARFLGKDKIMTPVLNGEIRRFADYAAGEIENVILLQNLKQDTLSRKLFLVKHFLGTNNSFLIDHYLDGAYHQSTEKNDLLSKNMSLDYLLIAYAKLQTDSASNKLKELTRQKFNFIQELYHRNLSEYYNMVTNMSIDDSDLLKEAVFPDKKAFEQLFRQSAGSLYSVVYKLSLARLNFTNENLCRSLLDSCKRELKEFSVRNEDWSKIYRRILFTRVSFGLHFGWDNEMVLEESRELLLHNEKNKYYDDGAFFYFLFCLLLQGGIAEAEKTFKVKRSLYFKHKPSALMNFLESLYAFRTKDDKALKHKLAKVTYGDSYYMVVWSRLLELIYWANKRDVIYFDNLCYRLERYLKNHKNKPFTLDDNLLLVKLIKEFAHKGNSPRLQQRGKELRSVYHRLLFTQLK